MKSFEILFEPSRLETFFESHWTQQHALFHSYENVDNVISLNAIEYLISSSSNPDDNLIVSPGLPVRPFHERVLHLASALRAYEAGASILLTKLERRWPWAIDLCRSTFEAFERTGVSIKREVNANLYLTPPNSAAFPTHYDDHDVFIIQLQGRKHWTIYGGHERFPIARQSDSVDVDSLPPRVAQLSLSPGDILYIPRGAYHDAHTETDLSIHITLGIFALTWLDVACTFLADQQEFRKTVSSRRGVDRMTAGV